MTDGDIVHGRPNYGYKKPYEAICEGRKEASWLLLKELQKDIKKLGNLPVLIAKQMAQYLGQEIEKGKPNWSALMKNLERIKNEYLSSIPHYCLSTIFQAVKRILNEFKYQDRTETHNLSQVLIEQYIKELYQSQFEERINLHFTHHKDISSDLLCERIQNIRLEIYPTIEKWAKTIIENEDVNKLRRPNRKNIQPIDMNEDLLTS